MWILSSICRSFFRGNHWCSWFNTHGKYESPANSGNDMPIDIIIEGSLEVKLPTIWTDEKQSREEAERRERLEERRVEEKETEERRCRCAKRSESRETLCFSGSGGSRSRLAKAAGAEPSGQMRDEKLHAVVARSTFRSQNVQKHTRFGPLLLVEMSKKCTPLWREAHFESQDVQNAPLSDHFY